MSSQTQEDIITHAQDLKGALEVWILVKVRSMNDDLDRLPHTINTCQRLTSQVFVRWKFEVFCLMPPCKPLPQRVTQSDGGGAASKRCRNWR